jgi:hypothetical protein
MYLTSDCHNFGWRMAWLDALSVSTPRAVCWLQVIKQQCSLLVHMLVVSQLSQGTAWPSSAPFAAHHIMATPRDRDRQQPTLKISHSQWGAKHSQGTAGIPPAKTCLNNMMSDGVAARGDNATWASRNQLGKWRPAGSCCECNDTQNPSSWRPRE